jgi:DNA-directed RNA polymerase specialized sigma24 family protein
MNAEVTSKGEVSAEDFQRLLRRLDPEPERAWQAYDDLRRKLIVFFERLRDADAVELAEEVLDRVAKKGDPYEIRNAAEFAFGVARNLRREALRKAASRVDVPDLAALEDPRTREAGLETVVIDKIEGERRRGCVLRCLDTWLEEDRRLLFAYYPLDDDRLEEARLRLADSRRMTIGALRTRMFRLREKLESCFRACCARGRSDRK